MQKEGDKNEANLLDVVQPKLFEDVSKAVDNIVRKIGRLQRNVTTNFTERYMSVVSKFAGGKRINFTSGGSYQRRCLGAALAYNINVRLMTLRMTRIMDPMQSRRYQTYLKKNF